MNKNAVIGIVVVVLIILGVVAWSMTNRSAVPQESEKDESDFQEMTEQEYSTSPAAVNGKVSPTPTASVSSVVKQFALTASEFKFSPTEIKVKKGDTVKVTLTNDGQMPHNFVVDQFQANTKTIASGETDAVTFTADKAGTFEFYCSVGNHRKLGMVGKLIVE